MRGSRERRVHVAARECRGAHQIRRGPQRVRAVHLNRAGFQRLKRIGQRREDFVIDFYFGGRHARVMLRIGDDHGQEISHAAGGLAHGHENRQVGDGDARAALGENIGCRKNSNHAGHRLRLFRVDRQNFRARMLAQHHRTVQHSRHAHVVHERLFAQRLIQPAKAQRRHPDSISNAQLFPDWPARISDRGSGQNPRRRSYAAGARRSAVACRFSRPRRRSESRPGSARIPCTGKRAHRATWPPPRGYPPCRCSTSDAARTTIPGMQKPHCTPPFEHERVAQHPAHILWKPFQGNDFAASHLLRLAQAGHGRAPVHHHRAAAAGAFRGAAVLRGCDAALLAQHVEEVHPRLVRDLGRLTIQMELDFWHVFTHGRHAGRAGWSSRLRGPTSI